MRFALLLLCVSCAPTHRAGAAPPNSARHHNVELPAPLRLRGESDLATEDGRTAKLFGPIYLDDAFKAAPILVVQLDDVRMAPGSSATVYLGNAGPGSFDPKDLIGTIETLREGGPPSLSTALEINDFTVGKKKYTARTTFESLASFSLVVVATGPIELGDITLVGKHAPR